jgi:hypothetical protein
MNIQKLKLAELNPAAYNPRKALKPGDPEFEKLKNSIEHFGYVELIVVNSKNNNTVISGHQRLSVLKHIGQTEVECVIVELDTEQEKALNIAMNKVAGDWDKNKLLLVIADLQGSDFDVSLTGFDADELADLFDGKKDIEEDDFDVDKALGSEAFVKKGDVWLLDRHRLFCGDSTNSADDRSRRQLLKYLIHRYERHSVFPLNINRSLFHKPTHRSRPQHERRQSEAKQYPWRKRRHMPSLF